MAPEGLVADPDGTPIIRVRGSGADPRTSAGLAGEADWPGPAQILDRVKPLRGRRIVVTRSAEQAGPFAAPVPWARSRYFPGDPLRGLRAGELAEPRRLE